MKWDQAEPGYVSTLPWTDCPFYLWFNNVGFCFFHNDTDSQEKRSFLCVKLQLGIWCEVCQGFWKAIGTATVDFLAQFLSVFWAYLLLHKSHDYENTTLLNTHIPTAQMRGGGGSLCWPVRESCYWYSWGKEISAHFAYLISVCF